MTGLRVQRSRPCPPRRGSRLGFVRGSQAIGAALQRGSTPRRARRLLLAEGQEGAVQQGSPTRATVPGLRRGALGCEGQAPRGSDHHTSSRGLPDSPRPSRQAHSLRPSALAPTPLIGLLRGGGGHRGSKPFQPLGPAPFGRQQPRVALHQSREPGSIRTRETPPSARNGPPPNRTRPAPGGCWAVIDGCFDPVDGAPNHSREVLRAFPCPHGPAVHPTSPCAGSSRAPNRRRLHVKYT